MKNSIKFAIGIILLIVIVLLSLFFSGAVSCCELWDALIDPQRNEAISNILWEIRLPRILGAAASGILLAAAGCTVQLLFRNPLSSPHVLGAVNASALGAVAVMALGAASLSMMLLGSISGALLAILLLLFIGRGSRQTASLLLAGIALNAFASAMMSGILFVAGERLEGLIFWLLGGFWRLDWIRSIVLLAAAVVVCVVLLTVRREMNMLYLGERAASSAGVNTRNIILTAVLTSALATAMVVASCGVIGFVGLLVPHMARGIFGGDFRIHLLGSGLTGAVLMIAADWGARSIFAPLEVPIGVVTAIIGAPFFLLLVLGVLQKRMEK